MTDLVTAIDALVDGPTTTPRRVDDADRLTGAAVALLAISRILPAWHPHPIDTTVDPGTGQLTLQLVDHLEAMGLANRLGLRRSLRVTEVDDGWVAHRWSGQWADWPVVVIHTARDESLASVAKRGPHAAGDVK